MSSQYSRSRICSRSAVAYKQSMDHRNTSCFSAITVLHKQSLFSLPRHIMFYRSHGLTIASSPGRRLPLEIFLWRSSFDHTIFFLLNCVVQLRLKQIQLKKLVAFHHQSSRLWCCSWSPKPEKTFTYYLMYLPLVHITVIFHLKRIVSSLHSFVYSFKFFIRFLLGPTVVYMQLIIVINVSFVPDGQYAMILSLQENDCQISLLELDIILALSKKRGCLRGTFS